ncbi:MAG: LamG domain-containing protein, partial [Planctomycetota bacterium]
MKADNNIKKLISDLADRTSADMDERILKDSLRALGQSEKTPAASGANIWRKTIKISATAAAAIVIVGVLIGINLFSNSGRQAGNEITTEHERGLDKAFAERGSHDNKSLHVKSEGQGTGGKLGMELSNIEEMFKAGNVDGLVAVLAEGEIESKVASADYLARLGAIEAVEPLEYLRGEYNSYGMDNPFAKAVEKIKSRTGAEILTDDTTDAGEGKSAAVAMHAEDSAERIKSGRLDMGEPLSGFMGEPREAKEVADGYPIKGDGSSIAEVVPASTHQNLVLYYSFHAGEDPNTAVDISGNNFHGQIHGTRYAKDEILGGVMSFDGDDDYISIPDVYLDGFTISAWVKVPEPDSMNNRRLFTLYDEEHCYAIEGNTRGGISVGAEKIGAKETKTTDVAGETTTAETDTTAFTGAEDSDKISTESEWARSNWAEGAQFSDYDWRLKPNTWTHITVTYDGVTGRIYRNGKLKEEGDIPAEGFTGTAYIGGIDRHNGGFWRGMLDEVALFNRALSEEEVGQLYLMTGEMVATGPTLTEGAVATGPTLTEGASGNGYYFDGDGDYIDVGTISGLGVEQTKMLWIYMEAYPLPHDVYLIDEGGNNNWIELIDSDGNGVPEIR